MKIFENIKLAFAWLQIDLKSAQRGILSLIHIVINYIIITSLQ